MSFVKNLFSSPNAPQAPNPSTLAGAQSSANESTARLNAKLNRANTYTPFGSVTYEDKGNDKWQVNQTFSPEMQGMFDTQNQIGQGVLDAANTRVSNLDNSQFSLDGVQDYQQSIDRSGLAGIPGLYDFDTARQEAEDASFNRVWDRLDPQFDQQRESLVNNLANTGITVGSDAYKKEMKRFTDRYDDARIAAGYDSVAAGRDAFNNLFSNSLVARQQGESELLNDASMANAGRQQQINDQLLTRGTNLNELAALLQGAPALQTPQQQPLAMTGAAPPDVQGAYAQQYGGQLANYNAQVGQQNANMQGLYGLGAAYIGG